ncbi:MAG: dihydrolipoamide acetyltransferase family protein [Chloroflexota bacterium]|nr:dihydrolipoamide acetyltransferase family protein [Chloroflexota bacterium]
MPTEVKLPHLGESIDSAVVVAWHRSTGDAVKRGDELADLETDKATLSLEAPKSGVLLAIVAYEGQTVYIGDLLAVIGRDGETWSSSSQAQQESAEIDPKTETTAPAPAQKRASASRYKISPLARKKAKDLGVDLASVRPADGVKVSSADVEAFAAASASSADKLAQPLGGSEENDHARAIYQSRAASAAGSLINKRRIELSHAKRLTGQRMLHSAQAVPQFSLTIDADAGQLLAAHSAAKAAARDLSLSAMLIQITAKTLVEHGLLNARFEDEGITIFESVHIGVATATRDGLRVPVIHDADKLSLDQINRSLGELTGKARENRLQLADVSDATFTISNLGMTGITQFTPLVNPPQSAILGVAAPRPLFTPGADGGLALSRQMALTAACDHRVLDGADAAAFLRDLKAEIESFHTDP